MVRLLLALGLVGALPFGTNVDQAVPRADLQLVLPSVALEGETFTGVIVERTREGAKPVGAGKFSMGGKVLKVSSEGTITIPAAKGKVGNFQFDGQYDGESTQMSVTGLRAHVQILNAAGDLPCRITTASEIFNGARPLRVRGTGLDKLKSCALKSPGAQLELSNRVGSSLEQVCIPPVGTRLQPRSYTVAGVNRDGKAVTCPTATVAPRVRVDGSDIRQRGDRGDFTLTTTADTWVRLEGGEGMISLDRRHAKTTVANPAKVGFTADRVGTYIMRAVPISNEDREAESDAPKIDCSADKPECVPSADAQSTSATCPVRVTGAGGKPVADATVQVAVSKDDQIAYGTCTTDAAGRGSVIVNLVGSVVLDATNVHPYSVPGYDWNKPGDPTILIDDGAGPPEPAHFCQGHRLAIVIGPNTDRSIAGAAEQIRPMAGVQHKIWIDVPVSGMPTMNKGRVPVADGSRWGGMDQTIEEIAATYRDCCYWDEVLIVSHGSQSGLWRRMIEKLAILTNARPLRKITFWVCEASADVYPNHSNNERVFEKLAHTVRPRNCPCHCLPANCSARNADGASAKCPTRADPVRLYMAGLVAIPNRADGYCNPTRLGMNVVPSLTLTSGDGRISETTITDSQGGAPLAKPGTTSRAAADPNVTTTTTITGPGTDVFNGLRVAADPTLTDKREAMDAAKRTSGSTVFVPNGFTDPAYTGPDANQNCKHPAKEGCMARPT